MEWVNSRDAEVDWPRVMQRKLDGYKKKQNLFNVTFITPGTRRGPEVDDVHLHIEVNESKCLCVCMCMSVCAFVSQPLCLPVLSAYLCIAFIKVLAHSQAKYSCTHAKK